MLNKVIEEIEKEFDDKFAWEALRGDLYVDIKGYFHSSLLRLISEIKKEVKEIDLVFYVEGTGNYLDYTPKEIKKKILKILE